MKNKIVGIDICILLISSLTALSVTPYNINEHKITQQCSDTTSVPLLPSRGWIKIFHEFGEDTGYSVQQTEDGGYIIAGYTHNTGGRGYIWLIKTDNNGNKVWNKTFGEKEGNQAYSVQQTSDVGYILVGVTNYSGAGAGSDIWLIKTDEFGTMVWDTIFGGTDRDEAYAVQQTADMGYIIAGMTFSYGAGWVDAWLIKTDEHGDEQWNKTYEGTHIDMAKSVQQTLDDGYIITGITYSSATRADMWLIKTDINGEIMWQKAFGGTGYDCGSCVQRTSDGGYIIGGITDSFGAGDKDFWLIKTDSNGNKTWDKTFGGTNVDEAYSVQQTSDNGYIIVGETHSFGAGIINVWLVKTDADGNKMWDRTVGKRYGNFAYSVQQTTDSGYIITGGTGGYGDVNGDLWLIKTDSQGKSKTTSFNTLWFNWLFQRFPHVFPLLRQLMRY